MKRITGTFFDIIHHNPGESRYWHDAVIAYREPEWRRFMAHMRDSGLDTVLLIGAVCRGEALFPDHPFLPTHACLGDCDHLEAALAGADEAGLDFHMGLGFQETYSHEIHHTPEAVKRTLLLAECLLERYGGHPSFTSWYIADEFGFNEFGDFNPEPVGYVSEVSRELAKLTPRMKRTISPYFHNNCVVPDPAKLVPQIESMNVHAVSVQNGVTRPDVDERHFVALREAFDRVEAGFWGNVELFAAAGRKDGEYIPLAPGKYSRVREQMAWVEPYAEKLICYQMMGLMNDIGLGRQPDAADLWHEYMREHGA